MKAVTVATAALLIIWIGGAIAIYFMFDGWTERGQFGDMFGAVNALFSSFALVGVILAVSLQKQELTLQRKELEMTRDELSRTAKAQEDASASLERQIEKQVLAGRISGISALLRSFDSELEALNAFNAAADESRRNSKSIFAASSFPTRPTVEIERQRNAYRMELIQILSEAGQEFTETGYYTEVIDERT